MPLTADIEIEPKISSPIKKDHQLVCDHCGEPCEDITREDGHVFCCEGCKQVFQILNQTDACDPSMMEGLKGILPKGKFKTDKWNYLDEPEIVSKLVSFSNSKQVHILLKLPNIHCSSCIWLLEHLNRINPAVLSSTVDFNKKEAALVFDPSRIKLSSLAALLEYIGYPPMISYADNEKKRTQQSNRDTLLRIGIAGFCFSNIMMLSFPDYLASEGVDEKLLSTTFNYISLLLSLPVLLYAAAPFFIQGWKGIRQKFLNIDAPIALAILITFSRSVYEILSGTGTGYLDSMSGIVFFMLIGRWFQEKTQEAVSFERDYRSFFPMSALVLGDEQKQYKPIEKIEVDDRILVRNQELIPADAVLNKGQALIDYSFVTGEKDPVPVQVGQIIFAGGKQVGASIELRVIRTVSTSHLTRLWNNETFQYKNKEASFVHPWSRYFSTVLFAIAIASAVYWEIHDPANTWKAITSVLIVACPCSLLLSATFTFGNLVRIFGAKGLYLKNANVIERIAEADTLVLDKTGTLTEATTSSIHFEGKLISHNEAMVVRAVAAESAHPLSRMLSAWNHDSNQQEQEMQVTTFKERAGQGIEAVCGGHKVRMGRLEFTDPTNTSMHTPIERTHKNGAVVHLSIDDMYKGKFIVRQQYRKGVFEMMHAISPMVNQVHILSGDNNREEATLQQQLHSNTILQFNKQPEEKLEYIRALKEKGKKVIMVGDGLNDAGALQQSDAGIAVTDNTNYFTPACDAILDGAALRNLDQLMQLARSGKKIVAVGFALSIAYNLVGMYFSTQALLSPLVAAILMPSSTISIILLTFLGTKWQLRNWQTKT